MKNTLLISVLFVAVSSLGYGQLTFELPVQLFDHPVNNASYAYPIVPIDLNGDNATDFVVDLDGGEGFLILTNDGQDNFNETLIEGNASLVDVTDVDSDGDFDIVSRRRVHLNVGSSTYQSIGVIDQFEEIFDTGDVNGDGILDVVTIESNAFDPDTLRIYTLNTDLEPTLIYELVMDGFGYSEFVDIDIDGDVDLLSTTDSGVFVSLINNGSGNFSHQIVDGVDGDTDMLAFINADCNQFPEVVYFDFNNPNIATSNGVFSTSLKSKRISSISAYLLNTGDIDNDGKDDLVTVSNDVEGRKLEVFRNSGGYNFEQPFYVGPLATHSGSTVIKNSNGNEKQKNLWVYDYDSDGLDDIIVVDGYANPATVLLYRNASGSDHLSCTFDDITLTSQQEVDDFLSTYGDCEVYETNLTISGDDITDLSGLAELKILNGCLTIDNNPILQTLNGFSLSFLRTNIVITNNAILTDISMIDDIFFYELICLDMITIEGNPLLRDCDLEYFCDEFTSFSTNGEANISNNGPGCQSVEDVINSCLSAIDNDNDGFSANEDCNDNDPMIFPGAEELCDNKDNDCNGEVDEGLPEFIYYLDTDMDGYGTTESIFCEEQTLPIWALLPGDCVSFDPSINPGAIDIPNNGIDENCDGEDSLDMDEDGFSSDVDCDDTDPLINPDAIEEAYNGLDDDCNPDTLDDDLDQDGFVFADDCDDTDPLINPDAEDVPNNDIDEDCDGEDTLSSVYDLSGITVTIGPNPVNDVISIIFDHINIQGLITIYAINGNKLIEQNINATNITLNTSRLNSGLYLLKITNSQSASIVKRLVIE